MSVGYIVFWGLLTLAVLFEICGVTFQLKRIADALEENQNE